MVKDITYLEDYKLVSEYIEGNEECGIILYSKLFENKMLEKFIYKYTAKSNLSIEDKQEILEETLMESVENLWKYNGNSKFTTFVIGFAQNKCREKIRKKNNIIELELDEEQIIDEDYNYYNQDPSIIIIKKEEAKKINTAMSRLEEEDKQIIQLRIINEITAKKISEMTGENIEAIYSRYRRALKKFRKIYEEM